MELSPLTNGEKQQVRPGVLTLEAGQQLGNQESQVLVPAPPQTCWCPWAISAPLCASPTERVVQIISEECGI